MVEQRSTGQETHQDTLLQDTTWEETSNHLPHATIVESDIIMDLMQQPHMTQAKAQIFHSIIIGSLIVWILGQNSLQAWVVNFYDVPAWHS